MTNYDAVVAILRTQREARQWTDEAVATDLCTQLGLDPQGEATHATVSSGDPQAVTEDDVTAHEQAAYNAQQKAKEARAELNAQQQAEGAEPTPSSQPPSADPLDLAPGTMEPNLPPVPAPAAAVEEPPEDPEQDKARAKMAADASKRDAKHK